MQATKKIQEITVYAPEDIHEKLRKLSFIRRVSMSKIIVQVIEDYIQSLKNA